MPYILIQDRVSSPRLPSLNMSATIHVFIEKKSRYFMRVEHGVGSMIAFYWEPQSLMITLHGNHEI